MGEVLASVRAVASLPLVRRGYDCDATSALVREIEGRLAAAVADRDAARKELAELKKQIHQDHGRKQAIADALVLASKIRSDTQREAEEMRARATRELEDLRAEGKRRADAILRAAQTDAQRLVDDARTRAAAVDQQRRTTTRLADELHGHLTAFLSASEHPGEEHSAGDDLMAGVEGAAAADES
jgi:cell division septum initiation protein DivIVA